MCLNLGTNWRRQLKAIRSKTEPIKVYKILAEDRRSPYRCTRWKMGWNKSNRSSRELSTVDIQYAIVTRGFHFYRYKKAAVEEFHHDCECIWEVEILPEDVVAVGTFDHEASIVATRAKLVRKVK